MSPQPSPWRRPLCQTRPGHMSRARNEALRRFGHCHVCGEPCDGAHSFGGAPLLCDRHCPLCSAATQIETAVLTSYEVR
jgi:hypothetical protein